MKTRAYVGMYGCMIMAYMASSAVYTILFTVLMLLHLALLIFSEE